MASLALVRWYVFTHCVMLKLGAQLTRPIMQGYQMAKNLQSKLSPSDSISLFDVNKDAMHRLAEDMRTSQAGGAVVKLAEDVADAGKDAVRLSSSYHPTSLLRLPLFSLFL